MFPSRNKSFLVSSDNHKHEEPPVFWQFPSPFLDHSTNLHPHPLSTTTDPLPKGKCVRKKRSVGKKDRHSKIHTAQGLRDRRMRLSVHTARKFFDLNDLLGFDKASQTVEWLFSKSKKAIQQVTESFQSHQAQLTNKDEVLEVQSDQITDPNGDFDQTQLGFSKNLEGDHNMEDQSLEYSNTYHFLKQLHLDNTSTVSRSDGESYMGNSITSISTMFDYSKSMEEPPAGWLNSRNTFLGFFGGWDSWSSRMESDNIAPLMASSINGDNPSSGIMSSNFNL